MDFSTSPMAGRGCVVTGAGRGLGAALALDLLDQRATVVALSRQHNELDELARLASERGLGNNLLVQVGSTLDPQCTSSAIAQLQVRGCELNLLVANASVFGPRELLIDSSPEAWEDAVTTNVLGLSRSCRAAIPALQQAQDAQILVIGSAIGHQQSSHASAYAVSKAMAWSLVKCLSLELAPAQIAVNEWIPGPLHTSMNPVAGDLPVCRQPDDPLVLNFFRSLCQMKCPMPSGQSFSLRPQP